MLQKRQIEEHVLFAQCRVVLFDAIDGIATPHVVLVRVVRARRLHHEAAVLANLWVAHPSWEEGHVAPLLEAIADRVAPLFEAIHQHLARDDRHLSITQRLEVHVVVRDLEDELFKLALHHLVARLKLRVALKEILLVYAPQRLGPVFWHLHRAQQLARLLVVHAKVKGLPLEAHLDARAQLLCHPRKGLELRLVVRPVEFADRVEAIVHERADLPAVLALGKSHALVDDGRLDRTDDVAQKGAEHVVDVGVLVRPLELVLFVQRRLDGVDLLEERAQRAALGLGWRLGVHGDDDKLLARAVRQPRVHVCISVPAVALARVRSDGAVIKLVLVAQPAQDGRARALDVHVGAHILDEQVAKDAWQVLQRARAEQSTRRARGGRRVDARVSHAVFGEVVASEAGALLAEEAVPLGLDGGGVLARLVEEGLQLLARERVDPPQRAQLRRLRKVLEQRELTLAFEPSEIERARHI